MAIDRNPKFGQDQAFTEGAHRVTDFLWNTTGGDLSQFPHSYVETLRHEYMDGKISMLEVIDRIDLGPEATYEEYCEVVDALLSVDPGSWPDADLIVGVPSENLLYEFETDLDFSEFAFEDFAENPPPADPSGDPLSDKMELFFKKVISSIYLEGVTSVTDAQGNPPNKANRYLMSGDGKAFSGIFYDQSPGEKPIQYNFSITEDSNGKWTLRY